MVGVLEKENDLLFKVLTSLDLTLSDGIRGRLKALASTKLKVKTANRQTVNQATACVRTAHTLHVWFRFYGGLRLTCLFLFR